MRFSTWGDITFVDVAYDLNDLKAISNSSTRIGVKRLLIEEISSEVFGTDVGDSFE